MNKLQQISALATAFLAGQQTANAQIVYTNIDPDKTMTWFPPLALDIDNNGDLDVTFEAHILDTTGWNTRTGKIEQHGSGFSAAITAIDTENVKAFVYGDLISGDATWNIIATDGPVNGANELFRIIYYTGFGSLTEPVTSWFSGAHHSGEFHNKMNRFAGVRKLEGGNYYYGWVRLSCEYIFSDNIYLTVHDYAFNFTPNDPIYAGETGLDCNFLFQLPPVSISPTTTAVKWQPVVGAEKYKIRYRETGATTWSGVIVNAPKINKKLTGLTCDTDYEWKIASSCDGGATFSAYSEIKTFTTGTCRTAASNIIDPNILIYPNPANAIVYVDLDGIDELTDIKISDVNGKIVKLISATENEFMQIDISELIPGIYLMNISGSKTNLNKKIVKQ
ncbi:MAG: T9SS type A sorting domain-containing protein [Chitinophagales bacterium]